MRPTICMYSYTVSSTYFLEKADRYHYVDGQCTDFDLKTQCNQQIEEEKEMRGYKKFIST